MASRTWMELQKETSFSPQSMVGDLGSGREVRATKACWAQVEAIVPEVVGGM